MSNSENDFMNCFLIYNKINLRRFFRRFTFILKLLSVNSKYIIVIAIKQLTSEMVTEIKNKAVLVYFYMIVCVIFFAIVICGGVIVWAFGRW